MKKVNKILLLFFFLCAAILYGAWIFIHTDKFSKEASLRVSKELFQKTGTDLKFDSVEFSLFPLKTVFKNVELFKNDPTLLKIAVTTKQLEVKFSYSSFLVRSLQIKEIEIYSGKVDLDIYKKSNEKFEIEKFSTSDFFEDYDLIYSQLPVRINNLSVHDVDLRVDQFRTFIKEADLSPNKNKIGIDVELLDVNYDLPDFKIYPLHLDSLKLKASLRSEAWRVETFEALERSQKIQIKGILNNEKNGLHLKTSGEIALDGEEVVEKLDYEKKMLKGIEGDFKIKFNSFGLLLDQTITTDIEVFNAASQWVKLEYIKAQLIKKKNFIELSKFTANNNDENYLLKKSENIFDLKKGKFTDFNIKARLQNAYTNTFLYAIHDSLSILKGRVSGDIDIKLTSKDISFAIDTPASLKDFKLETPDGKTAILKNKGFEISKALITLDEKLDLKMNLDLKMANSYLKAKGFIDSHGLEFNVNDSTIDLAALGPIADVQLKGRGPFDLKIHGPFSNIVFDFNVNWKDFEVVDIRLGQVVSKFQFDIENLLIDIESLEGKFQNTDYKGKGIVGFNDHNEGLDLKVDVQHSSYGDIKAMLPLIFKNIQLPEDPQFNFLGKFDLKGGFDLNKFDIQGNVKGSDFLFMHEAADRLMFNFSLRDSILSFNDVSFTKNRGEILAKVDVNLEKGVFALTGTTKSLRLRDFNLYKRTGLIYDGDLNLSLVGNGHFKDFRIQMESEVENAFVGNRPVNGSKLNLEIDNKRLVLIAHLLGETIKSESKIDLVSKIADVNVGIDTDNIPELLGTISAHNIEDNQLNGQIQASLKSKVNLNHLGVERFELDIHKFKIARNDFNLVIDPRFNKVIVQEGIVNKWDLLFVDGKNYLRSQARNISKGVIEVDHNFILGANGLELITNHIEKAQGKISGSSKVRLDQKVTITQLNVQGEDQSLKIRNVPGFVTDLNYRIFKHDDAFILRNLEAIYGEGKVRVWGKASFKDFYPDLSFRYWVNDSRIPILKKSNIIIDAQGNFKGNSIPYLLEGSVSVLHGEILEDPTDLLKKSRVSISEYEKYLPDKREGSGIGLINTKLDITAVNRLVIKNNLAEIYVKGRGEISGDLMGPDLYTRIEVIPTVSKLKFKGHDFVLSQGFVDLKESGKNRISDVKVLGSADISSYLMKIDINGSIENLNIDLASEPALAKEDLLSLLTFGVTSDMSKNLEAQDRRSVTTVGIGTLLVDQLKINEDLNSTLGLKLSVQPEFEEDETALIQSKSAQSDGSTSRLKSATKIKINKQINDRVDVSVSSTVGGSLEQKQEMNINYIINKKFSLEGVYEVKPNEDENGTTPNSFGFDLKWRHSF